MLGKGLESLIPPHKSSGPAGQASAQPPLEPARELPAPASEDFLPAAPEPRKIESQEPQKIEPQKVSRKPRERGDEQIYYVELAKIIPNKNQPRRHFDEESIKELASSIREYGVLQPIIVTKHEEEVATGTEVKYELIAGERRVLASRLLGLERIPAIIRHVDLERERLELAVIENIQRENLNPVEMARAFARLQDEFRLTQREIAARLGKSRETVANTLRLLDLPTYIQEAIEKGEISESHGRLLLGVDDPAARQALFQDLVAKGLTTRELRAQARRAGKKRAPAESAADLPEAEFMEQRLASELGAPVTIHMKASPPGGGSGAGKIMIDFYSEEELRNIISRIVKEQE